MATYATLPETTAAEDQQPRRFKVLVGGAAIAAFVLGALAATATSVAAPPSATNLRSSAIDQIRLKEDPNWCLAVENHRTVSQYSRLEIYECKPKRDAAQYGQSFKPFTNSDGKMQIRYVGAQIDNSVLCVSAPMKGYEYQKKDSFYLDDCGSPAAGTAAGEQFSYYHSNGGIGTFKLNSRALESQDICMKVKDGKLKDRQAIVGAKCTGNGGVFDTAQLWTIGGSAPRPPTPAPRPGGQKCGDICFRDSDCLTSGGFGCTRCSSYDVGAHGTCY
ncbi:unnamed protein product [Pelagomonas calceolata]|uniref:Uncharacterized protein n=1 Tax=Pelagomonas calceolata TaxID=35677 RepID=A0A8J2SNN9_9STRA|nr:unnamed protein product [Pelagomonas calceolata]